MKFISKISKKSFTNFIIKKKTFLNNGEDQKKRKTKIKSFNSLNQNFFTKIFYKEKKKSYEYKQVQNFDVLIIGSPELDGKKINVDQILNIFYKNKKDLFFLSGTWVIIIYDNFTKKTYIFRDYSGVKPIFFIKKENHIFLSSNLGFFLENNFSQKKLNFDFVFNFLHCHPKCTFGRKDTFFNDINTFSPTDYIEIDSSLNISVKKFYDENSFSLKNFKNINFSKDFSKNIKNFLATILKDNKKNLATSTSGGIDSAMILWNLKKNLSNKSEIHSYTVAFDNKYNFDETKMSKLIAKDFSDKHKILNINYKDLIKDLPKIYKFLDTPIPTASLYGFYYLYRHLSKYKYDKIFSGYGGNYLNAGVYPSYLFNFLDIINIKKFKNEFKNWQNIHDTTKHPKNKKTFNDFVKDHYDTSIKGKVLDKFFYLTDKNLLKFNIKRKKYRDNSKILNFGNYLDSYNHYAIMYDSVAQAADLEDNLDYLTNIKSVSPLTEKSLIAFGLSLKQHQKIKNGVNRVEIRKVFKNKLLSELLENPHTEGFKLPTNQWFSKEMRSFLLRIIKSKKFKSIKFFSNKEIKKLFLEHISNNRDHSMIIWLIINFYFWIKKWKIKF